MTIFLPLLFLTAVSSVLWLIYQYSVGRKSLFKAGMIAILVWLLGLGVAAAIGFWFVLAAIPGHAPDSFSFYSRIFLGGSAIWSLSIFPYLLIM
jgi:hypothetical protein